MECPILLIGGPGRSGTNVLKDIFRRHPAVLGLPFETRFVVDPDGVAPTYRLLRESWTPFVSETALKRLERLLGRVARKSLLDRAAVQLERVLKAAKFSGSLRQYKEWELEAVFPGFSGAAAKLLSDLRLIEYRGTWAGAPGSLRDNRRFVGHTDTMGSVTTAFRSFFHTIYNGALRQAGKVYYVDDNTFNILFAQELLELLPGACLVHMIRDPRDVVASYLHQRWCPDSPSEAISFYQAVMQRWFEIRDRLPRERYAEIRLEDLCRDRERVLKEVCDLSSIPFHSSLLDLPLDRANANRWRQDFDEESQQVVLQELEPFLVEYGYQE